MRNAARIGPTCSLVILLTLGACATRPVALPQVAKGNWQAVGQYLDQRVEREMNRWHVQGVSVAVVDDQRVMVAKGYGLAGDEPSSAATSASLYRAGSISKLLTATEVMRRVRAGEIALDAPLQAQLPGFRIQNRFGATHPVTVRALLAHHSGLPSDLLCGMWLDHPASLKALQASLAQEWLAAPPQTQYRYSNLDYSLLGRLIEVKSGESFSSAMDHGVLHLLGMRHSHFEATAEIAGPHATPHRDGQAVDPAGLRDSPAGGLVTSADDLARFLSALFAGGAPALDQHGVNAMLSPQYRGIPLDFGQEVGLGWMLSGVEVPGTRSVAWHTGEYPGYASAILMSPADKIGVVVLTNDENGKKFALDVAKKALELAIAAKTGVIPSDGAQDAGSKSPVDIGAARLDALAGNYVVMDNLSRFSRQGTQLSAGLFGTTFDLVPVSADRFLVKKSFLGFLTFPLRDLSIEFVEADQRHFAVLRGLPNPLPFERLVPRPIPAAWRKRLGTYVAMNSDNNMSFGKFELAVEDGVLVAKTRISSQVWGTHDAPARIPLIPFSDSGAAVAGTNGLAGSVVHATSCARVEGLRYSGYLFCRER